MSSPNPQPRRRHRLLTSIGGIAISLVAIGILANAVPLEETAAALAAAAWQPLAAAAALVCVQLLAVTRRWAILIGPITPRGTVPVRRLLIPVLLGYIGNFILPARLGEVVRAYVVSRREPLTFLAAIGSVVLDRIVDTTVLAVVVLLAAMSLDAPAWIVQVAAVATVLAVGALVVLASPLAARLSALVARIPVGAAATVSAAIDRFLRGADVGRRSSAVLQASVLSAVSWLCEGTVYWLVAISLGIDVAFPEALLVAGFTILATAVPSAPAYVGTFELAVTAVATTFGVPAADALAWGVLAHLVTAAPLAIGGIISLVAAGYAPGGLMREAEDAEATADAEPVSP